MIAHTHNHTHTHTHTHTQSEVDMDTGEPQDQLTHLALDYLEALGSNYTTPSKIVETKDQVVYEAIQDGLDRANQQATSNAQRVRT